MSKCTAAIYSAEMALQGDYGFSLWFMNTYSPELCKVIRTA